MKFEFGIGDLPGQLRAFADDLEAKTILAQTVVNQTRQSVDDFEIKSLVIKYVEAKEK